MPGDSAKKSEAASGPRLEWQRELDQTMEAIDSRLVHPRRRTEDGPPPRLPDLDRLNLTNELLDEIAWRVAAQMRRHAEAFPSPPAEERKPAPPLPEKDPGMRPGAVLMIRFRMPILPWPLRLLQRRRRRRKQHPLTTVKASA